MLRTLNPVPELFSLGGPTETTIWSIWHPIAPQDIGSVPYGHPVPANSYFICHDNGIHCPAGVVGRIYTAGVNLALGYLEQGELKQHDFVILEDANGQPLRTFRTGDRGYYCADGNIIFASRVNGYVKIRGVRVSLPEIEDVLRSHPAVGDIVVVDYPGGDNYESVLGAMYLTYDGKPLPQPEFRTFATGYLPGTHIPTRFIHVSALPLSANGKIDRHSVRAELSSQQDVPTMFSCTQSSRYGEVLSIYCKVIGVEPRPEWGQETAFIVMGLKLSHIKLVAQRLNQVFGTQLVSSSLMSCKNALEVGALLTE